MLSIHLYIPQSNYSAIEKPIDISIFKYIPLCILIIHAPWRLLSMGVNFIYLNWYFLYPFCSSLGPLHFFSCFFFFFFLKPNKNLSACLMQRNFSFLSEFLISADTSYLGPTCFTGYLTKYFFSKTYIVSIPDKELILLRLIYSFSPYYVNI